MADHRLPLAPSKVEDFARSLAAQLGVGGVTMPPLSDAAAAWLKPVAEDLPGTVREYAARTYTQDVPIDESLVRWWGNIGYMRPMRSQVDLVYRDEAGVDHLYYAARRDELTGEWRALLEQYGEI